MGKGNYRPARGGYPKQNQIWRPWRQRMRERTDVYVKSNAENGFHGPPPLLMSGVALSQKTACCRASSGSWHTCASGTVPSRQAHPPRSIEPYVFFYKKKKRAARSTGDMRRRAGDVLFKCTWRGVEISNPQLLAAWRLRVAQVASSAWRCVDLRRLRCRDEMNNT